MYCNKKPSPCLTCTRVSDPRDCENKNCVLWQRWFVERWNMIRAYPRLQMEQAQLKPVGVNVGGNYYAAPHQVEDYRKKDPCQGCVCANGLCSSPCPEKRAWEARRGEVFI